MTRFGDQELISFPSATYPPSAVTTAHANGSPAVRRQLTEWMRPAVPTKVFLSYWGFATERQEVFFRRLAGGSAPWTSDPVIAAHRFTNAYRAADRVSQYLIREVQGGRWSAQNLFFRTLLFKFFNRIATWELLKTYVGEPEFSSDYLRAAAVALEGAMKRNTRIYSAAYIMPSGGKHSGFRYKHELHLWLLGKMMADELPAQLNRARSMAEAFALLRSYPTVGDFLAYQYVTDLNYSTLMDFEESEFVVAGPGAHEGIDKCFSSLGGMDAEAIIRRVAAIQEKAFSALGLRFRKLGERKLQLIDCQNLFCEVGKFARVRHPDATPRGGRTRIKQRFTPNSNPLEFRFPLNWGLHLQSEPVDRHVADV